MSENALGSCAIDTATGTSSRIRKRIIRICCVTLTCPADLHVEFKQLDRVVAPNCLALRIRQNSRVIKPVRCILHAFERIVRAVVQLLRTKRVDCAGTSSHSRPSHSRSRRNSSANSGLLRSPSMSSIRIRKTPLCCLARSCATMADQAWPKCSMPFGLGANLVTTIIDSNSLFSRFSVKPCLWKGHLSRG